MEKINTINNRENRFFHVTLKNNYQSILKNGLIPQIGYFSKLYGETDNSIYVFSKIEQMEDALVTWLGEAYEQYCEANNLLFDNLELLICVIDLPDNIKPDGDFNFFEQCINQKIYPQFIRFFDENYNEIFQI